MSSHFITDLPAVAHGAVVSTMTTRICDLASRLRRTTNDTQRPQTYRISLPIEPVSPLSWLAAQDTQRKVFWGDRTGAWQMAGIGAAETITMNAPINPAPLFKRLDYVLSEAPEGLRYFGGMRFDYRMRPKNPDSPWRCVPDCLFILPRFEVLHYGENSVFACNLLDSDMDQKRIDKIVSELEAVTFVPSTLTLPTPSLEGRIDTPDRAMWQAAVTSALQSIDETSLLKIVLARETYLPSPQSVTPWALLEQLRSAGECFTFAIQFDPSTVFFGASPERLYSRKGQLIETEAQAGTRLRLGSADENARLATELKASEKDRTEHAFVIDGITQALTKIGVTHKVDSDVSVRATPSLQHLYVRIYGRLPENTEPSAAPDATLFGALHPTPAVAGLPALDSLDRIAELEQFDRGWYAGPIGWIAPDRSEFAVAIRSALVRSGETRMYAGAGIVRGSKAEDEWFEIENKMSPVLRLLTGS